MKKLSLLVLGITFLVINNGFSLVGQNGSKGLCMISCEQQALGAIAAPPPPLPPPKPQPPKPGTNHKRGKLIQSSLKEKGYDPGPLDGIIGPKTRSAMKAFQKAMGLGETGRPNESTLQKLGLVKEK